MRNNLVLFAIVVISSTALPARSEITIPLSVQALQEGEQFHGSKVLTFTKTTSPAIAVPPEWTEVESAAIIDNPLMQPVTIIRFKKADGAVEYAMPPDGAAGYDSASVLHFHANGDRSIAEMAIALRLKNKPGEAPRRIAGQIVLTGDRVIARIAECRTGLIRTGDHSYPMRLYMPSINNPFYSLSSDAFCIVDMNGDGNFSQRWELTDSGQTIVPSERIILTDPFNLNGAKLKATGIDSAGSMLSCSDYHSDTAAVVAFKAPNFALADIAGISHTLSGLKDKVILVSFWSTGCSYCEKIREDLNALVQRCDSSVFKSVAAALDSDRATLAAFLHDKPYAGIIAPYDASFWKIYNPRMTTPVFYVIDRDGSIIFSGSGASMFAIVERLIMKRIQDK
jgi:thiol-disulfide isomerase/thioredoxin